MIGSVQALVNVKWGFEYQDNFFSRSETIRATSVAYFNDAEYGVDEYSVGVFVQTIRPNLGGSGTVLQLGLETNVDGAPISVQRIDCYVKQGKTL